MGGYSSDATAHDRARELERRAEMAPTFSEAQRLTAQADSLRRSAARRGLGGLVPLLRN
ncbi:hypothetical protein [Sphingomonas ginsenosidimutans]|jgi:hypothetical protein|uniref:hypothetical protein n=1 Tax=Sphingomonas ginsenosidimutans TaxID=862134 RepID=UPI001596BE15|nr:hypothetical protein [Sphingomonas ginsenosidimutans]